MPNYTEDEWLLDCDIATSCDTLEDFSRKMEKSGKYSAFEIKLLRDASKLLEQVHEELLQEVPRT